MRTRARRGAVWWLYGGSVVGGSGVAHDVVNGREMVPGWGDQPTGEWSALGSLSREAGSASARPGPGLEGVSGTAQQAGAGKAGGLDLGWPSRWPSTEAGRTGITRYAITSQLRPGSMNYPSLCNHCIDTPDWESPVQPLCKKLGCCHGFVLVAPPALPYRQTRWRVPRLTAATCTAVPSSMAHRSIAFIMSAEGDWSDVTMSALFMRGIGEPSHPPRRPKLGFTEEAKLLPRLRTPHDASFELLSWGPSANSSVNRRAKPPSLARLDHVVTSRVLPMDATIPCRRADRCMSIAGPYLEARSSAGSLLGTALLVQEAQESH